VDWYHHIVLTLSFKLVSFFTYITVKADSLAYTFVVQLYFCLSVWLFVSFGQSLGLSLYHFLLPWLANKRTYVNIPYTDLRQQRVVLFHKRLCDVGHNKKYRKNNYTLIVFFLAVNDVAFNADCEMVCFRTRNSFICWPTFFYENVPLWCRAWPSTANDCFWRIVVEWNQR